MPGPCAVSGPGDARPPSCRRGRTRRAGRPSPYPDAVGTCSPTTPRGSTVHAHWPSAMRLTATEARARLAAHDHGVLCTVHPERGVDAVPVVYVVGEEGHVGIPVDRVKQKSSSRLQRERNLEADPRAALLVEHWERDDWSRLWWVRAELRRDGEPPSSRVSDLSERLAARYPQYHDKPFT